jgi:hypothetical protein
MKKLAYILEIHISAWMIIILETIPGSKKVYATNYCISRNYYTLLLTVLSYAVGTDGLCVCVCA